MINDSRVIEKGHGSTFEVPRSCELQNYYTNMITYLNSEFQLSRTNSSRVIEKGRDSTFEVCHALLSCRTTVQI